MEPAFKAQIYNRTMELFRALLTIEVLSGYSLVISALMVMFSAFLLIVPGRLGEAEFMYGRERPV